MVRKSKIPRKIALILVAAVTLAALCAVPAASSAYTFPNAIWDVFPQWNAALAADNKTEIIRTGNLLLDVLRNQPRNEQIMGVRANVYSAFISAYKTLEDYDRVVEYLKLDIDASKFMGWDDRLRTNEIQLFHYDLNINVFAETSDMSAVPFFDQKLEPRNGIYIGRVRNSHPDRLPLRENEGIISFYAHFIRESFESYDWFIRDYDDNTRIIHFAWVLFEENSGLATVLSPSSDQHIIDTLKYINSIQSPTMLRIFNEMNVWADLADPDAYIRAYRKIARLARIHAPDTALIWSPNNISNWNVDKDEYYPGDEYVDWVGVSLYSMKYFNPNNPRQVRSPAEDAFYFNGVYQNPILMLQDIVNRYGNKKPIIITEGSGPHRINPSGEDTTAEAVKYIRHIYRYASIVFPQVKAAIYFDQEISNSLYGFKLATNRTVSNAYFDALNSNPALNHNLKTSDTAYIPADRLTERSGANRLNLATYAVFPNHKQTTVEYFVNDNLHTRATEIPYSASINVPNGSSRLRVVVRNGNYSKTLNYIINRTADGLITCRTVPEANPVTRTITAVFGAPVYRLNGETFAAQALTYNGVAYLPAAFLARKLGIDARWDAATNITFLTSGTSVDPATAVAPQAHPSGTRQVSVITGAPVYMLDGVPLTEQALTFNGVAYLPAAYFARALGLTAVWDPATNITNLTSGSR